MKTDIIIVRAIFLIVLCINSLKAQKLKGNKYLEENRHPSDYSDGILFNRLKDLKGNIEKIDSKEYELTETGEFKEIYHNFSFVLEFDNNYRIVKSSGQNGNGISSNTYYHNFLKGKISRWEVFDINNEIIRLEESKYDSSDFLINYYVKNENGDEKNLHFNVEILDENNFIYHGREHDSYYQNNKFIKSISTDSGNYTHYVCNYIDDCRFEKHYFRGCLSHEEIYKNDYLVSYISYDDNEKIKSEYIKIYDKNHNMIGDVSKTYKNGLFEEEYYNQIYIYDSNDLFVEEKRLLGDGLYHSVYKNEYDSLGNIIKNGYNGHIIQYKYDSNNNWVEKFEYKNSKLILKFFRKIEYY